MEMRIDDEVDLARIAIYPFEPCTDLLAGREADTEQPCHALAETTGGIVLAVGMQAGIEQRPSLGMLDQIDRDRHGDVAFAALH